MSKYFWHEYNAAIKFIKQGNTEQAVRVLHSLSDLLGTQPSAPIWKGRTELLHKTLRLYNLSVQPARKEANLDTYIEKVIQGVSLVSCCMNRAENLIKALQTWLSLEEIGEVIIVDWSSDQPVACALNDAGIQDRRIKVVRVSGQTKWVLSHAYNIGFRIAGHDKILKVDADITLKADFFQRNILSKNDFIAGDWRVVPRDQHHINGFFYIHRDNLFKVNGFNEYITTYGWDDTDLYARLTEASLARRTVDTDTIYHLPHDDNQRIQGNNLLHGYAQLRSLPQFSNRTNRYISFFMPLWDRNRKMRHFVVRHVGESLLECIGNGEPLKVHDNIFSEAEFFAAREMLSWRLGIDCLRLNRDQMNYLLKTYTFTEITKEVVNVVLIDRNRLIATNQTCRGKIYVNVQHGLGNRIRVYASAKLIAEKTNRQLVLVWIPDEHCDCEFNDLFETKEYVINSMIGLSLDKMDKYNYMDNEENSYKDEKIKVDSENDIYAKSSSVLKSIYSNWDDENRIIKTLQPVAEIRKLIDSIDVKDCIGVHIRMEGSATLNTKPPERPENWSEEGRNAIYYWREKSHYSVFIKRMDAILQETPEAKFFLATDRQETYDIFSEYYTDKVKYLRRNLYNRSKNQMYYGVADSILLSRCPHLLGSTWSSFTELAMRLSDVTQKIEMSGNEF